MLAAPHYRWSLAALIALIGLIHLYTAPDQFHDAAYQGLLFLANGAGAAVAATAILRRLRHAETLGLAIAAGTVIAYVWSRTIGLPELPVDGNVFEPLGVLAVAASLAYAALLLYAQRVPITPLLAESE